jgi:hypothetical protein
MAKRPFPLHLADGKVLMLAGGPYPECPEEYFGVKMAAEIHLVCDVSIPTHDFSVPDVKDVDKGLYKTLWALLRGRKVYIGCRGGIGRTGLFMAILAKAFDVGDPVKYVRAKYLSYAVETGAQKAYVNDYEIPYLSRVLVQAIKFKARHWRGYAAVPPNLG